MTLPALELQWLAASAVWALVLILWAAYAARGQQGLKWAGGPRDEPRPVRGMAGRLERAQANFQETYPLFVGGVLAVVVTDQGDQLSVLGAATYVCARVVHAILYALGVPMVRSLAWLIATVGIGLVWSALFLP